MTDYIVRHTDTSVTPITVPEDTVDRTSVDVALVGRVFGNYGQDINEDLLNILENFSCPAQPAGTLYTSLPDLSQTSKTQLLHPIQGQFWFNSTSEIMYFWDATTWVPIPLRGTYAANWGQMVNGQQIPRPVNELGYVFPYDECIWSVSPAVITGSIDLLNCVTNDVATITMNYRYYGQTAIVPGIANYLIIGVNGNVNSGTLIPPFFPSPTPVVSPTTTNTPTPTVTPTVTRTITPTPSLTRSVTPTPASVVSPTPAASVTPSVTRTVTPTPAASPTPTPTPAGTLFGVSRSNSLVGAPTSAVLWIKGNTDGTLTVNATTSGGGTFNYYSPTTPGIGSGYQIRVSGTFFGVRSSGTAASASGKGGISFVAALPPLGNSAPFDSGWQSMDATNLISLNTSSTNLGGCQVDITTGTLEVRRISDGVVVWSRTIQLASESDSES